MAALHRDDNLVLCACWAATSWHYVDAYALAACVSSYHACKPYQLRQQLATGSVGALLLTELDQSGALRIKQDSFACMQ